MPIRPHEFDKVALQLEPLLEGLPGVVVAVTGAMGSGKTTAARFLAWYFNVTLIETDHYLKPGEGFAYDPREIERIVRRRLAIARPVIVEGIKVLDILGEIGSCPVAIVRVLNRNEQDTSLPDGTNECPTAINCPMYLLEVSH